MKTCIRLVLVLLLAMGGCRKRPPQTNQPDHIKSVQETPTRPQPEKPKVRPVKDAIVSADKKTNEAQSKVREVLRVAEKTPAAQTAVPPLKEADEKLSGVKADHAAGLAAAEETEKQIDEAAIVITENDKIQDENLAKVKEAAEKNRQESAKVIAELNEYIAKVESEKFEKAGWIIFWLSLALMGGGAGSIALMFTSGFPAGLKVGPPLIVVGALAFWLSFNIRTVNTWIGWGVGIGVGLTLLYAAYHFFTRDPACPIHKLEFVRKPKGEK